MRAGRRGFRPIHFYDAFDLRRPAPKEHATSTAATRAHGEPLGKPHAAAQPMRYRYSEGVRSHVDVLLSDCSHVQYCTLYTVAGPARVVVLLQWHDAARHGPRSRLQDVRRGGPESPRRPPSAESGGTGRLERRPRSADAHIPNPIPNTVRPHRDLSKTPTVSRPQMWLSAHRDHTDMLTEV